MSIVVHNQEKQAVEFAYILNLSNNNWAITDNFGSTQLPKNTVLNDSLKIQRYGYNSSKCVYNGSNLLVLLSDKPILLENIEVLAFEGDKGIGYKKGNIHKKPGHENISHKEYLELLPGVQVKTFGGPGSIVTVSLNGGPTSQTKVTINGFDLTNMQTGVSDLSKLPTAFINEARVIISGEKLLSSGSQNGVLELNTWKPTNSFSSTIGSFNKSSTNFQFSLQSKIFNVSLISGINKNNGDFQVKWREKSFKRLNNNFNQNYGSLQFIGRLTPKLFLKGFTLITEQERGVPGLVWSPINATHNDKLNILSSSLNWFTNLGEGSISIMHKISDDNYYNPTYNNKNKNRLKSSSLIIKNPVFNRSKLISFLKFSIQNQKLNSDGIKYQKYFFLLNSSSVYSLSSNTTISGTIQNNYSKNFFNNQTASFAIKYNFKKSALIDMANFSHSSHFRHPTFNDLYWKPGGNVNLKSETGINNSVNFWLKPISKNVISLNLFYSQTDNLIQWLPVQSYWQARNIENVERYGFTGNWVFNSTLLNSRLSLSSIESHYGINKDPLRYSPETIGTIFLEKKLNTLSISTSSHFTGEMISAYSYPKNSTIPSNSTTSIHVDNTIPLKKIELITSFSIINALNQDYESSRGYPEPGRSFEFTLTINQKKEILK